MKAESSSAMLKAEGGRGKFISKFSLFSSHFQLLLLGAWMAIGAFLRFARLDSKPPWTDEFSTMVFSLGHSFRSVPLNQVISIDELLLPLQRESSQTGLFASIQNVIHYLLSESNHPPVYFVLANLWMRLFPATEGEYINLWVARSLPALLGVASIPAVFYLAKFAFRSRSVGHLAAAMMAVSPYGIYIAQEARHYALAILVAIASLSCFAIATRKIASRKASLFSVRLALIWVFVNSLGIAVHYFFTLTLCAEAIVLIALWMKAEGLRQRAKDKKFYFSVVSFQSPWWRIGVVAAGTIVGGLVWLPVWQSSADSGLTEWIQSGSRVGLAWISPIFQAFGTWLTIISLLPVETSDLAVTLVSGLGMLIFFLWALPILWRGLKVQLTSGENRQVTLVFGGFVLSAIALFFGFTYILGIDLTRGPRYAFVYFPAAIVLVGASLAIAWNTEESFRIFKTNFKINGKKAVVLIWLMGLASAITVVENLGYQKYYQPDLLVPIIQQTSAFSPSPNAHSSIPNQALIATTHKTHVQTGEMMGIAWEFKRQYPALTSNAAPRFLLVHQERDSATKTLQSTLAQLPRPMDLWLVNFYAPVDLESQKCSIVKQPPDGFLESWLTMDGYDYQLYRCQR